MRTAAHRCGARGCDPAGNPAGTRHLQGTGSATHSYFAKGYAGQVPLSRMNTYRNRDEDKLTFNQSAKQGIYPESEATRDTVSTNASARRIRSRREMVNGGIK